jgi:pimeloyl-ACP methyl ester carboxylesterase
MSQLGDDLRRVLEGVAPDGPLVLVGHSLGGMTIMAMADQHAEFFRSRVHGVALISTSAGGLGDLTLGAPEVVARSLRRVLPRLVSALGRNVELVERGRQISNDLGVLVTRQYAFASPTPVQLSDFVLEMINATPVDVIAQFYPAFLVHDALPALSVLEDVQTLVLVGEQDRLTPPEHSRAIAGAVPGAQLVVLDPGGHLVLLERPDDVNGYLLDLLASVSAAAAASP